MAERGIGALLDDPATARQAVETLIDTSPNVILLVDLDGEVVSVNSTTERIFGVDPNQLRGRKLTEVVETFQAKCAGSDSLSAVMDRIRAHDDLSLSMTFDSDNLHAYTIRLKEPRAIDVHVYGAPVRAAGRRVGTIWTFADYTEIARSDAQLRTLADVSPIPLIITRVADGHILYCNPPLASIVGMDAKEMVGRVSPDFYADPADRTRLLDILARDGIVRGEEIRVKRRDGTLRWAVFSLTTTKLREEDVIIGGLHDITERREAEEALERTTRELREKQAQLVQSEKMASLGMLVAGIAHEINTPIGAVRSMHQTLMLAFDRLREELTSTIGDDLGSNKKITKALTIIDDANRVISEGSTRVTDIVRRLKSFARLDEAELKDANLNDGIESTLGLIRHELKLGVTVVKELSPLPPIACYPGQLNQVFLNILMNARQAISGDGEIRIKTELDGKIVRISISDTGCGIPKDKLDRVFDPGFTTKGVGVGTGLGLSICYGIVRDHKGKISVQSEVGVGTTFAIEIPTNLAELTNVSE